MKKFYFLLTFLFLSHFAKAQNPDAFVMTFEVTTQTGLNITVPIVQDSANNYTVDFGDGTILSNQTGNVSHSYSTAGIYTVSLTGTFGHIRFATLNANLKSKLKTVEQWGINQWINMERAFTGCSNLIINAIDAPDLSQVTDMTHMFSGTTSFNQSINHWNVSNITNMTQTFFQAVSFDQPLNNWDVSNVITMKGMFSQINEFNQPLDNWDVSNVTDMSHMFNYSLSFNQSINNWNVSNVTDMSYMFDSASSFNQNLNDWNVSNVNNMQAMFWGATSFNQPLNDWDVSNVINMSSMFGSADSFNQPLDTWDISNVVYISYMFSHALSFNQPINNWNTSNIISLNGLFTGATSFNQPLDNWDVSNISSFGSYEYNMGVFGGAESFNQDISNWHFNDNSVLLNFINNSGLDSINYDLLLLRFLSLGLENKLLLTNGLEYCDQNVRNYLTNDLGWTINGDSLSGNCGDNHIIGIVLYDEENNGCNENDMLLHGILIKASDGDASSSTFSTNGEYTLNVYEGSHTISLLNLPNYLSYHPENEIITFNNNENIETLNFCLTANQTVQDLNIALLPISEARPGFEADYQLIVQNLGTQTTNNVLVTLTFDDTKQSFVSANPTENSATANQLYFEITSLSPFSSAIIDFTMETFTPPTVNGGDILSFSATVSPNIDDYTPYDNSFGFRQIVVNSFDPNDKLVLQGSEIHIDEVNEYLHYIVRFQNTGTASAINVRIEDELHESLDWNTIQILNSSHNYRVEITDGNQMEFIFNNINLPYEDEDEEGSNGFIAYKIKPIAGLEVGDIITGNKAYIYFDYNLPIITNTTSTEVVEDTSSVSVPSLNNLISVYPNPTNGILHLSSKENIIIEEVKIYNLQGRELFGSTTNQQTINIENLSAGIYLMNIKTNQGSISKRVIKK